MTNMAPSFIDYNINSMIIWTGLSYKMFHSQRLEYCLIYNVKKIHINKETLDFKVHIRITAMKKIIYYFLNTEVYFVYGKMNKY